MNRSDMASFMEQQIQKRTLGTKEGNPNKTQISLIRIYLSYLILMITDSLSNVRRDEKLQVVCVHTGKHVSLKNCCSEIPGYTECRTIKFQQPALLLQLQGILLSSSHSGEKCNPFNNAFQAPGVLQKSGSLQRSSPRIARHHRTPLYRHYLPCFILPLSQKGTP